MINIKSNDKMRAYYEPSNIFNLQFYDVNIDLNWIKLVNLSLSQNKCSYIYI